MPDVQNLLDTAKNLGGIITLVFYVAIVLWTYKDARRRIDDPILVATAVAASMLPLIGVFVYMLLRPPEYLADVRERELEIRAMERTLGRQERCPYCRSHIESEYLSCPVCMSKLREECVTCDKPLDPRWAMCPYCETEVARRGGVDAPGRGGRQGGAEPRPSRSTSPRRGASKPKAPAKSTSSKAPARRSSSTPESTPARPNRTASEPTESPRPSRSEPATDINTEPFSSAIPPRFVRSEQPQSLRTTDMPTMIHTGPTTTPEH